MKLLIVYDGEDVVASCEGRTYALGGIIGHQLYTRDGRIMPNSKRPKPVPAWWRHGVITVWRGACITYAIVFCGCAQLGGMMSPLAAGSVAVKDQGGGTWTLGYEAPSDAWEWMWSVLRIGIIGAVCSGAVIAVLWLVHSRAKRIWPDVPASVSPVNLGGNGGSRDEIHK